MLTAVYGYERVRLLLCTRISGFTRPNFTTFSVPAVVCGRSSVLVCRRRDTLCTSGLWMTSYFGVMSLATLLRYGSSLAAVCAYGLTPLLYGIGCTLSKMTAGAKTE